MKQPPVYHEVSITTNRISEFRSEKTAVLRQIGLLVV